MFWAKPDDNSNKITWNNINWINFGIYNNKCCCIKVDYVLESVYSLMYYFNKAMDFCLWIRKSSASANILYIMNIRNPFVIFILPSFSFLFFLSFFLISVAHFSFYFNIVPKNLEVGCVMYIFFPVGWQKMCVCNCLWIICGYIVIVEYKCSLANVPHEYINHMHKIYSKDCVHFESGRPTEKMPFKQSE